MTKVAQRSLEDTHSCSSDEEDSKWGKPGTSLSPKHVSSIIAVRETSPTMVTVSLPPFVQELRAELADKDDEIEAFKQVDIVQFQRSRTVHDHMHALPCTV